MKYYRGLLFFGGGEVCMSLVWISKATVLCIEQAMSLSVLHYCICNVFCPHLNCFNYVAFSRPSSRKVLG